MILVRSPLRITLGGGGTDLPDYASEFGGFCLTAAITQYVYVSVIRPFEPGIYLKYSQLEKVAAIEDVQHPIIREALRMVHLEPQVEITTLADVPSGTGLGSSSSFSTALLKALGVFACPTFHVQNEQLADWACRLEMDLIKSPIGKQDQFASACGGILALTTRTDGGVECQRLKLSDEARYGLEDRLLLFFTGYTRETNAQIRSQSNEALGEIKAIGRSSLRAIQEHDWNWLGALFDEHWQAKQRRSKTISNSQINAWYDLARQHGAMGGKLVGAGGGGCLLFLTNDPQQLRAGLKDSGLQEIRFRFDVEGTKVLTT